MSQENVEILRKAFDAFNRSGAEAIIEFIDPEFEGASPPELSVEPDTYRGHAGVRRYFAAFDDVMEEVRFYPEEFIDAGERVVVSMRLSAKGKGTGIEVEQHVFQVWTMRDGKAVHVEAYPDKGQALRAAGVHAQRSK